VNNAVTSEMYSVQVPESWIPSLTLTLTNRPVSFKADGHRSRDNLQTATGAQGSYT